MLSRKVTLLSASAAAVALIATLALARAVHMPATKGHHVPAWNGKFTGANPDVILVPNGMLACPAGLSGPECEKIKMLLPMSMNDVNGSSKPSRNI